MFIQTEIRCPAFKDIAVTPHLGCLYFRSLYFAMIHYFFVQVMV